MIISISFFFLSVESGFLSIEFFFWVIPGIKVIFSVSFLLTIKRIVNIIGTILIYRR